MISILILLSFTTTFTLTNVNGQMAMAQAGGGYFNYLRCWRCDYDDPEQCVKNFDFTKHKHEACDGKCLKAFEKVEARTKVEIDKAQLTPTIRKCVSQKEISSLQALGVNTKNGCHDLRTTKRRHKLYCFCETDLCNHSSRNSRAINNASHLVFSFILFYFVY